MIPIVDPDDRGSLAPLAAACRESGAFYLPQPASFLAAEAELLRLAGDFFALPPAERAIVARPDGGFTGYVAPGADHHDAFFALFEPEGDPQTIAVGWPARPTGLEAAMRAFVGAAHELGLRLLAALGAAFGQPDVFAPFFDPRPSGGINLRRYFSRPGVPSLLGPHRDPLPLTLIAQSGGGLESRLPSGDWEPAGPRPGLIICQLGDVMARWTNDRWVSNTHRVVHDDAARERLSIVASLPLKLDAPVACLPGCEQAGEPPHYAPTTFRALLGELMQRMKPGDG